MDEQIFEKVIAQMKAYSVETHLGESFAELTTLGVGGTITITIYPNTVRKVVKAVRLLSKLKVKFYVLGKGSNVLAADDCFDGVVIVTTKLAHVRIRGVVARVLAGTSTLALYKQLESHGLSGGEFLSCLPATVGGATVTNAGCYKQDVKSVLRSVTVLYNGRVKRLSAKKCHLTKRNSLFKQNAGYTLLSVRLKFSQLTVEQVRAKSRQMRKLKADTQPLNYRSAGCALYHDSVSISRLTDQAGLKGYTVGGAQVSTKHAGFILNVDKASAKDIYLTIQHVERELWERYGIVAKREICLVNFTKENGNLLEKR